MRSTRVASFAQVEVAGEHERLVAPHGAVHLAALVADPWLEVPVVEARGDAHAHVHAAALGLEHAQDAPVRVHGIRVRPHLHAVGQAQDPGVEVEGRDEHERVLQVLAFYRLHLRVRLDRAGATALKLFPAEGASPDVLKAHLAVLPKNLPVLAVGGIKPDNIRPWLDAGAAGFGLGSGLYKPGQSPAETVEKARAYVAGLGR